MVSKKHWSPGPDVVVQRIERSQSGTVIVSGTLVARGICPDCGIQSDRRHGWRRRHLQDFPAHGLRVSLTLGSGPIDFIRAA